MIKTTLVAVSTLNGFIADQQGLYPWASSEDREVFEKIYMKTGCIIIGRKTYDILKNRDPFPTPGRFCVVVTHESARSGDNPNIAFQNSPKDALRYLEQKGFRCALIGGGGTLNASFAHERLIDDILLTVEPTLIEKGIPLFNTMDFSLNLKLKNILKLSQQTIQIHYEVLK